MIEKYFNFIRSFHHRIREWAAATVFNVASAITVAAACTITIHGHTNLLFVLVGLIDPKS